MRVFIAGATGVLGRRLVRQFRDRDHEVVGLVRDPRGRQLVESFGGEAYEGNLFDVDSLAKGAKRADVVIRAATAIPRSIRPRGDSWAMNDRIRREGTQALTECAAKVGAGLYLQESIVWVARPPDGSAYDEDSPGQSDSITQSVLDSEAIAQRATEGSGLKAGTLRCGIFYGADAYHTRQIGEDLMRRRAPIVGRGDATWTLLHLDDAASAFVAAAEAKRGGLWHVVDDEPVGVGQFFWSFAKHLRAPRPRRVPTWLARLAAGRYVTELMVTPNRTSNAKFKREVGWAPRYPTFREGLDQIMESWRAEGFLVDKQGKA